MTVSTGCPASAEQSAASGYQRLVVHQLSKPVTISFSLKQNERHSSSTETIVTFASKNYEMTDYENNWT